MSSDEHTARIVERLRKDHPDPAVREELYGDRERLLAYVENLMSGQEADAATIAAIAGAVREAEDGLPYHDAT
jgi:hypothetical protein